VTIKAFHGGHLNGMSCRRLMVSIDGIMDSVAVVSHNRRDERQNDENSFSPCSRAKLEMKLKLYRETFQVLDAAFAGLRTIAPTRGELFGTKKAVKTLAWYWLELNLPETPKWHTFQDHSISGSHHSRFLRFPLWVGREILNIIRFVLWLAKKWMFTRKDPLLLTPGASERVPQEGVGEVGQLKLSRQGWI